MKTIKRLTLALIAFAAFPFGFVWGALVVGFEGGVDFAQSVEKF